ncbi:hypothetical protein [Halobacillus massiliensis]|uniref:hypothetical protein n=1 Tax=Halobacillus massiliensis TaxID=1926286 RepID=UPI0009E1F4B2|nr:hypothetical protein [Halobacillus massiliensis]
MSIPPYMVFRILAFLMAAAVFYALNSGTNEQKKEWTSSFLSFISTVFIYMFLMKFITNYSMLLEYPGAVAAYPSGTLEFYLALMATAVHYIKTARQEYTSSFLQAMLQMMAGSQFFFYFFLRVIEDDKVWVELTLWFFIFTGSLIIQKYYLVLWLLCMIAASVLSFTYIVPDVMAIRVHSFFYVILIGVFLFLLLKQRGFYKIGN